MNRHSTKARSAKTKIASRTRALERGRKSLDAQAWGTAFGHLAAADAEAPLESRDLEAQAMAAFLIGKETECADLLTRAHRGFADEGQPRKAALCAYRLGFTAMLNGDMAHAGGWFSRAERLLEGEGDCVEKGYLLLPVGYQGVHNGNAAQAYKTFVEAVKIGERFGEADLVTLARQGQGRALIRQGKIADGVALLDEAMIAVRAGDVSAITAGSVYCSVITACGEIFDLRRAQEWTAALDQWCNSQPDIVPYRNHCLVLRAEILQLHGAWPDALSEIQQACERLAQPPPKSELGGAFHSLGEIHRLRGDFAAAEEAYRKASRWQRSPQPGFARLRLLQGDIEAAYQAIRQVADEVKEVAPRSKVLDAYVEIALAAKDIGAARAAAEELAEIALEVNAPLLQAVAGRANGAVMLAEKDAQGALVELRKALGIWRELNAPYEAARVRVLIAQACRELGNCDAADMELGSAREIFEELGAAPALAHANILAENKTEDAAGPLTAREVEVLKLVASGMTNRKIAGTLGISEKTAARHLSNIFVKLDLSSRAAATAYAYEHKLV
jgi:DNA-binding CsgD family transcriptional regulator